MSLVPHNFSYFSAFALLLKPERIGADPLESPVGMGPEEACEYLEKLGAFVASEKDALRQAFPRQMVVRFLGGDPFLQEEGLAQMLQVVRRHKFQGEVCTTGLWVKSAKHISDVLARFEGSIHVLYIDTSRDLLTRVGAETLEMLIVEARARRLGVKVRCGVTENDPLPLKLLQLEIMNADTSIMQLVPMSHSSGAAGEFALTEPPLRRRCAESFGFFVTAGGDVFPCSGGAGISALCIGSLKSESVREVLMRIRPQHRLRHLRNHGPRALYEAVRRSENAARAHGPYIDGCDFHRQALSDPALRAVLEDDRSYPNPQIASRRLSSIPICTE